MWDLSNEVLNIDFGQVAAITSEVKKNTVDSTPTHPGPAEPEFFFQTPTSDTCLEI